MGEVLGEEQGRVTSNRILSGESPTVETSFTARGKMLGIDTNEMGTYVARMRPDGEGQGVIMSADGDAITWKGSGIGLFGAGGAISYRGAIFYSTSSERFARLNKVAGVFEYEVDGEGNTVGKIWEWK